MEKVLSPILLLVFPFLLSAQEEKKLVVATTSIFADMAEVMAGGQLDVQMIVPVGGNPHLYEPTLEDAQLVNRADLLLRNDLNLERWLNELIENSRTEAKIVTITEDIQPIESSQQKRVTDPHAWMNVANGLVYIENIKNALAALDPDNADIYEFNYGIYRQQLQDVDREIQHEINRVSPQWRVLITYHDGFRYYGKRYGLEVQNILDNSKDNDLEIVGELFSDSIGDKHSPAPTYLDMLRYNTATIVNALIKAAQVEQEVAETKKSNYGLFLVLGILLLGSILFVEIRLNR